MKKQHVQEVKSPAKVCQGPWELASTNWLPRAKNRRGSHRVPSPTVTIVSRQPRPASGPHPGRAQCCKCCVYAKMKCMVRGAPQSVKYVQAATEENMGPLQWGDNEPLFLELESEDGAEVRMETAGLEIPGNAATELTEALQVQTEALQVQTMTMQGQACIEEWLCTQMEQLSISLDQHHSSQQLLEALHVAVWGFRHGLGSGLDAWAGIATGWEEWSEGEEDEEQGWRCRWNDTLS